MTPREINRAIAESMGWMFHPSIANTWRTPEQVRTNIRLLRTADGPWSHPTEGRPPNYYGDLNACAEFEARITGDSKEYYAENIAVAVWGSAIGNTMSYLGASLSYLGASQLITATAPQRCEAYLRTIGKWRTE
jgi:hypothetical protein